MNHIVIGNKRNLWNERYSISGYQDHVIISTIGSKTSNTELEVADEKIIYMEDLETRKQVYGICGECNEPGTGWEWCQPYIDELIQQSQLNAVHSVWFKGYIISWDIENQEWIRSGGIKVALKSLNNSSCISTEFLNEIKSYLQIYLWRVIQCYGITQDPNTKDYMMILYYCEYGNLRNYCLNNESNCYLKINNLTKIAIGLLNIHNAGKIHKDFHLGNILIHIHPYISDLGMCQPANNENQSVKKEGTYGVLPYMAPEILRGHQYTKPSDIYSFGIVMNEYISQETPYNNVSHNHALAIKICKGLRPNIFKYTPNLLVDLITKCWDAKPENRPTAKELYQKLEKFKKLNLKNKYHSQIYEYDNKIKLNRSSEKRSNNIQTQPQAIYTSRLLNSKIFQSQ
ncbi:hypothetical protein RclHR1_09710004 [Rhizophagus clarus]|uniref:Protein kinase domain-containing protein n=1 Tax=Rhizophagus clarus TaxID=94130 RepID=A0A2Z6SB79_9GLOM|nr:hypothetical protein RclHR1_09710004 [Rhizophagus clarus]